MRVEAAAVQAAIEAVSRAAQATGSDFGALLATARRESGLDRNAEAKTSSAAGLFQFIESTWLDLVRKYGPKHGLDGLNLGDPAGRRAALALRYDPEIAARMAGELTRDNAAALRAGLGRDASAGETYAAHVLGAQGALAMLKAPAGASAAALLPKAAAANHALFFEKDGAARTAQALLAKLNIAPDTTPAPAARSPDAGGALFDLALRDAGDFARGLGFDLWSLALRAYRAREEG